MSARHSRQSKETDSEKAATSAAGPLAKRPLRDTGAFLFFFKRREFGPEARESHAQAIDSQVLIDIET